jgi:hypothetical protein
MMGWDAHYGTDRDFTKDKRVLQHGERCLTSEAQTVSAVVRLVCLGIPRWRMCAELELLVRYLSSHLVHCGRTGISVNLGTPLPHSHPGRGFCMRFIIIPCLQIMKVISCILDILRELSSD